jgi:hypothetical protein
MSDLDLDAIRRRYEHSGEQAPDSTTWANRLFASSADVPALLAEVERLNGLLEVVDALKPANDLVRKLRAETDAANAAHIESLQVEAIEQRQRAEAAEGEVERLKASQPDGGVALWYWRHGAITYDIYDSERAAADAAVYLEDYEGGIPIGIQFPDGRSMRIGDWLAYKHAIQRRSAREEADRAKGAMTPPRPTRTVLDPFIGHSVVVDDDEPAWLGKKAS